MKREILFRGLRTDGLGWVYGHYALDNQEEATIITIPPRQPIFRFKVKPETVGQFTGLLDKNGTKIFEEDVVSMIEISNTDVREYETDIKWEDGAFIMRSGEDDYDTFVAAWAHPSKDTYPEFEMEVIGNIHEQ